MMNNDELQVKAINNLFAETGRYFQHLPKKSKADKLDEGFRDIERIFFSDRRASNES